LRGVAGWGGAVGRWVRSVEVTARVGLDDELGGGGLFFPPAPPVAESPLPSAACWTHLFFHLRGCAGRRLHARCIVPSSATPPWRWRKDFAPLRVRPFARRLEAAGLLRPPRPNRFSAEARRLRFTAIVAPCGVGGAWSWTCGRESAAASELYERTRGEATSAAAISLDPQPRHCV